MKKARITCVQLHYEVKFYLLVLMHQMCFNETIVIEQGMDLLSYGELHWLEAGGYVDEAAPARAAAAATSAAA